MAGFHFLQDLLSEIIRRETKTGDDMTADRLAALQKILLLDAHFIFDSYTKMMAMEVEVAKLEVRDYVEDLERRAKELSELSRRDELTGLMNRRAFSEEARRAINMAQRSRYPISVIYFDLDGFKAVNDTQGHLAGDDVLRRVSTAVYKSLRETDIACRYGGDEFILLLPATPAEQATLVCKRLLSIYAPAGDGDVDFSFGIAQVGPRTYATVDEAISLADDMMYKAKSERRSGKPIRIHVKQFGE
jgi:diguanylate cyclase (GGDEF)-like protein